MTSEERERIKQQRELARQRAIRRDKVKKVATVLSPLLVVVVIFVIIFGIDRIETYINTIDYGKGFNEDGTIKNYDLSNVELIDYNNISADITEIVTETELDTEISELIGDETYLNTSSDVAVADGDSVNIDYVGTVDGVEFEGGSTDGAGTDLTIGSGSYIDTFEEQLIGSNPGDTVTVNVTFPDDYSTTELAGKAAVFEVVINGINSAVEFTDAYVLENYSDVASTVEEYRSYLREEMLSDELTAFIEDYLYINTTVNKLPSALVSNETKIYNAVHTYYFNYFNDTFYSQLGSYVYDTVYDYMQMTKSEYNTYIKDEATTAVTKYCIAQAIYADAGLTYTQANIDDALTAAGYEDTAFEETIESTGEAYWINKAIYNCVIEYLLEHVTVVR